MSDLIHIFLHLGEYVEIWAASMGAWLYVVLFLVIFAETGLVVVPFLPGDSLLFAVGAVAALPAASLNIALVIPLLVAAAVLGDAVNYSIGRAIGPKVFSAEAGGKSKLARIKNFFFNKRHLVRSQAFYERHGAKTIVIARFVPIVRTFAPFVAGVGKMEYRRFGLFNITGAVAWVNLCVVAGYFFGQIEEVKKNFEIVIIAIIVISIMPLVVSYLLERRKRKAEEAKAPAVDLPVRRAAKPGSAVTEDAAASSTEPPA